MKRKFYIIAHNPNDISKSDSALDDGANALEPDIAFDANEFWVYHRVVGHIHHKSGDPTLKQYCLDLADLLIQNPNYNLALIAWDMKNVEDSGFYFWKIRDIIKENFIDKLNAVGYGEIPILFTPSRARFCVNFQMKYLFLFLCFKTAMS